MARVIVPHWHGCEFYFESACDDCLKKILDDHPTDCEVDACRPCGIRDCPHGNSTHYFPAGCGSCTETERHE